MKNIISMGMTTMNYTPSEKLLDEVMRLYAARRAATPPQTTRNRDGEI